jgi:hypothetical protein
MLNEVHPGLFVSRVPYRAMGLWLGRQLVVSRLPKGGVWIHSPIPWSPALRSAVTDLGEVRHVVGPNRYHDECLREFQTEYPAARFHAAPGLAEARRDIRFVPAALSDEPHPDWADIIDQHLVRGMPRLNEVVFFHRPSRSLIIADLAFNFGPGTHWLLAAVMKLNGGFGQFAPTLFEKSMMKDRTAVRASIDHILSWDFDRVIAGHGENIESGGRDAVRRAFEFLRG